LEDIRVGLTSMETLVTEEFALNDREVVQAEADVSRSGVHRFAVNAGVFKIKPYRCDRCHIRIGDCLEGVLLVDILIDKIANAVFKTHMTRSAVSHIDVCLLETTMDCGCGNLECA